jgi:hypothetical protein
MKSMACKFIVCLGIALLTACSFSCLLLFTSRLPRISAVSLAIAAERANTPVAFICAFAVGFTVGLVLVIRRQAFDDLRDLKDMKYVRRMTCERVSCAGEATPVTAARQMERVSWRRVLKLLAYLLCSFWFFTIFYVVPNMGARDPRAGRERMTPITVAAALAIWVSLGTLRARLLAIPLWIAILYWLYYMWSK